MPAAVCLRSVRCFRVLFEIHFQFTHRVSAFLLFHLQESATKKWTSLRNHRVVICQRIILYVANICYQLYLTGLGNEPALRFSERLRLIACFQLEYVYLARFHIFFLHFRLGFTETEYHLSLIFSETPSQLSKLESQLARSRLLISKLEKKKLSSVSFAAVVFE